jgi:hypothetical protein
MSAVGADRAHLSQEWRNPADHESISPTHWKDQYGGTISLNPGVSEGAEVPNYITADTATRKAQWFRTKELVDVALL